MTTNSLSENETQSHTRINTSLLSKPEMVFIHWFVSRAPDWVTPDILTAIGFAGTLLTFIGYCLTLIDARFLWLASIGLVINWFGDSTDGNMARFRHIERPRYGYFLDHLVDSVSMILIIIGIGISPYVQFNIALLALVAYMLLSIFVYLDTAVNKTFQLSYGGLGPTEGRLIIILANSLMLVTGNKAFTFKLGTFTLFDLIAIILTIVLLIFFVTMTIKRLRYLAKLEPEINYRSKTEEDHTDQ
ncbi:MAG: CDP-alcohol phosphatidyltransferase family protein [Anaerolineaceae bacterium]|nr:CDP-alcohol phosphatidyltransferase family protein [Anaerolineaceae bacterium]